METNITERIQSLLAQVFHVPIEEIKPDLAVGDLPQWDSMGHMDVMLSLEEHFYLQIDTETISELTSIPAIREHLEKKAANV
jgi:acyl carrier protein